MNIIQGNDALNVLVDAWLCGFVTGASTVAAATGAPETQADLIAQHLADRITNDPLALEEVRREVTEILTGNDSGPRNVTVAPL